MNAIVTTFLVLATACGSEDHSPPDAQLASPTPVDQTIGCAQNQCGPGFATNEASAEDLAAAEGICFNGFYNSGCCGAPTVTRISTTPGNDYDVQCSCPVITSVPCKCDNNCYTCGTYNGCGDYCGDCPTYEDPCLIDPCGEECCAWEGSWCCGG